MRDTSSKPDISGAGYRQELGFTRNTGPLIRAQPLDRLDSKGHENSGDSRQTGSSSPTRLRRRRRLISLQRTNVRHGGLTADPLIRLVDAPPQAKRRFREQPYVQ